MLSSPVTSAPAGVAKNDAVNLDRCQAERPDAPPTPDGSGRGVSFGTLPCRVCGVRLWRGGSRGMGTPESAPFALTVRAAHGAVVVELAGDFDLSGVEPFHSCIDELITSSKDTVGVDLGNVSFIDSSGLTALLAARRLLADHDRELRFTHISAAASRVFALTGLTALFHVGADDTT